MGVWGWMKNIGSKTWESAKKVGRAIGTGVQKVGRAVKPVLNVASKVAGFAEKIPGMIGDTAKLIKGGIDKAGEYIDMIPESKLKDKLKEASSGAGELVDKGRQLADRGGEAIMGGVNQTKPWLDFAGKVTNRLM